MTDRPGPRVVVEGLVAGYGSRGPDVLRGVDMAVAPGAVVALVGPNGAGKSTLFRTLLGLHPTRAGRITIGDLDPARYRGRRGVGYLPEAVALPRGWTVGDWVGGSPRLRGRRSERARRAGYETLEALGVAHRSSARLETLSRGTARRVALAFVLAGSPPLVLLDEPLAALDAPARLRVRSAVAGLGERGATVLLATHELAEVPTLAPRALVVARGRILARLDRPAAPEMEALIVAAEDPDR